MNVFRTIRGDYGFLRDQVFPGDPYVNGFILIDDQLYRFNIAVNDNDIEYITKCIQSDHTGIVAAIRNIDKNKEYKVLSYDYGSFYACD